MGRFDCTKQPIQLVGTDFFFIINFKRKLNNLKHAYLSCMKFGQMMEKIDKVDNLCDFYASQ